MAFVRVFQDAQNRDDCSVLLLEGNSTGHDRLELALFERKVGCAIHGRSLTTILTPSTFILILCDVDDAAMDTSMMSPGRYNGQQAQMTPTQQRARQGSIGSWTDPYSPGGAYAQLGPDTMRCSIGSLGSISSLGMLGVSKE